MSGSDSRKQHLRGLMMNTGGGAEPDIPLGGIELHTETGLPGAQNIPDQGPVDRDHHHMHEQQCTITFQELDWRNRLMPFWMRKKDNIFFYFCILVLAILIALIIGIGGVAVYLIYN